LSCHEERAIFGFVVHLAQLRNRQLIVFIFCLYVSQGSSRPSLLPPIPFRIYLPPRKTKFQALAPLCILLHGFLQDLFLFFFLMLPDHQLSSSKRATRSPHDDKPNRAPPDPRTLPRYCPAAGTRLWRAAIRYFSNHPPKNLTVTFFLDHAGVGTAACSSESAFSRTLFRRDDRERTRRARARATSERFRGSTNGKSEGACRPLL